MNLYKEILADAIAGYLATCVPDERFDRLIEKRCCKALAEIKAIIDDDNLDDKECFERIERIVCVFEEIGSNSSRHDFG